MSKEKVFIVSDDQNTIDSLRLWSRNRGLACEVYSCEEWAAVAPVKLAQGQSSDALPQNVISFPGHKESVSSMQELEAEAIKNAIREFDGNLTNAAKALGIGRATLYRKIKQYNVDPSSYRQSQLKMSG